uniref:Uncharacterized protein n=1 Tax=Plectus sambesii TaxID=2011161 RepID=A0A914WUR1_9BILA
MHFPQISLIALLVIIVADFTNAASIKKTETLDKKNMQEKVGKNPDEEQAAVEAKEPEKGSDIDQD